VRVDGRAAPDHGRVLDACAAVGVDVPHFCDDPALSVRAHCRSCIVEMDGRFVAACATAARPAADVRTDTPRLRAYRRDLGELVRAECTPGGPVAAALVAWGADGTRYAPRAPRPADTTHPYLRLDLDACILCRRCERACAEVQGQFVYSAANRGADTELTWGGGTFVDTDCTACGACVATCPTGALTDTDALARPPTPATPHTRTTCGYCGVGCQLDVATDGHTVAHVDGATAAVNRGHLCVKGRYAHGFLHHGDRLRTPLVRENGALVPATWEVAIARVAAGLRGRTVAGLSSSRATNEENYLFQKWLRAGLGTNDVDCCARVCHAPSAAAMRAAFGTGAATNTYDDIERASLLLVVGANVTEAHPVVGARIKEAVLRGAQLLVVDPRRTELAAMADVHLQLRPGANVPLFNSLANVLVVEDRVDHAFLATRVEGWEAYRVAIAAHTPERWEPVTGVPAAKVREAARRYAAGCGDGAGCGNGAARPMMLHGLGVTEHVQGTDGVTLLCNLALLVGAVGRPGVGVNPLRGQNNVQGSADMGAAPDLLPGYQPVSDPAARARVEAVWGRPIPPVPGRTIPRMYEAMVAGQLQALVVFGEDIVRTDAHSTAVRVALDHLEFLCCIELFLTDTAARADVVLPGASFLEKDGTFTNAERRVQRVRAVVPPVCGRADWQTLLALMAATGLPQRFRSPAEVMEEIAAVAPVFAGLRYDRLDGDGLQWPVPALDHPGTPILHVDTFPRPGGRAALSIVEWAPAPERLVPLTTPPGLALVTGRTLAHYNAGAMTRRTPNLALEGRAFLDIHPDDAAARAIPDGAAVTVTSTHGEARATARVTDRLPPGTVFLPFHFPETATNALTGHDRDRVTDCPAYKLTSVQISLTTNIPSPRRPVPFCVPFEALSMADLPRVGGKNAALGELVRTLAPVGVRVPPGFAITVDAYDAVLDQLDTRARLRDALAGLDVNDVADLARRAAEARAIVRRAGVPEPLAREIRAAYEALGGEVAVRSSATAEDLPDASFAGQQESFLNVVGASAVVDACLACFASLYTARAVSYRAAHGYDPLAVRLSVGVQRMVRADLGAAGVLFTLDPESGFRDAVVLSSAWGLGESVVAGRVDPDEHLVWKPGLGHAAAPIVRRRLGAKARKVVYAASGTRTVDVPPEDRARFALDDADVLQLAAWGVAVEAAWSARTGQPVPMDLEWAKDGRTGELFIVQARPETVRSRDDAGVLERWKLDREGEVLLRGQSVGARIGAGPVRVVRSVDELGSFREGDVLVAEMTDPDWVPVMKRAAAIITDGGGRTCHAAIVSRELGVPCIVGTQNATTTLAAGTPVTVDGSGGTEGRVLAGLLPYTRERIDAASLPRPRTRVMINLADPGRAFSLAALPVDGVGLLREEFVIANQIGVHPCAVLSPDRVSPADRAAIATRAQGFPTPEAWYVSRLAEGLGLIAAAFHPRPVIARFSDFKTNEYARLLGGAAFEPHEENPMIGWRGASRYADPRYRGAFGLECRAVRRVREDMGLTNLEVMVPFCRTAAEGRRVLAAMAEEGLLRAPDGPRVWVMCEIPANVIAIESFAAIFDGFSIGSNDLTQLVLGVDRDNALLAPLFDERDEAVTRTFTAAINGAHAAGRPIGICGQAPSDYPELARFLVRAGIDSVSLDPASVLRILPVLVDAERAPEPA
jgi:pyruvate,water dikinase